MLKWCIMHSPEVEEPDFIRRLKTREERAVEELMTQYEAKIFGLALRMTGSREDADEVLQDVFLTVFQKIDGFRGDSRLSSWIYRIATNASLMKLRKRSKFQEIPLEEELGPKMTKEGMIAEPVIDWSKLPDEEATRKELLQHIDEALRLLPADYRSVFVLRDIEELSAEEASQILKISVAALKSRLHRARLFLRRELADYMRVHYPNFKMVNSK